MNTTIDPKQAMLVCLSFTLPRQSIQLREEAGKIEDGAKADKGTVKAFLYYFQKNVGGNKNEDALSDLKSFQNEWRGQHARLTRPWDGNTRLLPAALIPAYMEMKAHYESKYPAQIEAFLDSYPEWAASAPERMGDLFAKSKFPSAEEVTGSITVSYSFLPLPATEQFKRISLIAPDMAATMETVTNEKIKKAVEDAQAQTWCDVMKPIQHIVDTLSKDKHKIYDCMISNVADIVSLVPAFNLQNDPNLAALAEKAKAELASIDVEDLRKSAEAKQSALAKAKAIVDEFEPFARKFIVE